MHTRELAVRVGVRELRNNLSRYLDRVRDGAEVVVTAHGQEVARMIPIDDSRHACVLDELIAEGLASPARRADRSLGGALIPASSPVSPLVAQQRR